MDEVGAERRPRIIGGVMVSRASGRLWFGLVIMTLGVLWTLDNLGLVDSERILRWWPVAVIALGLAKLFGAGTRRHLAWGTIFALVGLLLLGNALHVIHLDVWEMWPLILVFVGLGMLTRSIGRQRLGAIDDVESRLHTFAFWSNCVRKVGSQEFRGGELTAVMGGTEIDLRSATPVPEGAVLDLFVWWGGIDVRVPEHWRIVNESLVLLGAVEDETKAPPPDTRDTLILRGLVVMGGVEIKN